MKEITFDRFVRGMIAIAGIAASVYMLNYLSSVLLPFFVAWLIAYLIYPIVTFFQYKLRLHYRVLSIVVTLLVLCGILTVVFLFTIPPIVSEILHLKNLAITYLEKGIHDSTIPENMATFIREYIINQINVNKEIARNDVVELIRELTPRIWNLFYQTANILFNIISSCITLLYMFFLLMDYEKFSKGWISFIPYKQRDFVQTLVNDVEHGMNSYFRGQSLVALCVGILFSVGFLLIDFPMAIGLGLFIGALNMVPYLQLIGFVPTIILALLKAADTGQNFWGILALALLVFCVVQLIQDLILTPKIMGHLLGLSPALILLSLSVWGYLLGIIGLIIALPLTTLVMAYYKRYIIKPEDGLPQPAPDEPVL